MCPKFILLRDEISVEHFQNSNPSRGQPKKIKIDVYFNLDWVAISSPLICCANYSHVKFTGTGCFSSALFKGRAISILSLLNLQTSKYLSATNK